MKRIAPTSSTPLGAKKYPGGGKPAQKAITNGVSSGKSVVGGGLGAAKSTLGATANKAASTTNLNKTQKTLPKAFPDSNSYTSSISNYKPPFPGTEKKTAVRPGAPKPFTPPTSNNNDSAKKNISPYPGTNTKPGEASRTPVKRKFKPMERAAPQVEHGKMQHIAV